VPKKVNVTGITSIDPSLPPPVEAVECLYRQGL
jgi:hypothetical protein